MRILTIIFIFLSFSYSLDIDSKMFDNKDSLTYLKDIGKKIISDKINKTRSLKIIEEEEYYLSKIRKAILKDVFIEEYNFALLRKEELLLFDVMDSFEKYLSLKQKIVLQNKLSNELQNKLSFSRKQISNFTKEQKDKALLYQLQFAYFKLQKQNIEKRVELLQKYEKEIFELLVNSFDKLRLDEKDTKLDKKIVEEKINRLSQEKTDLFIQLDKIRLEENEQALGKITNSLKQTEVLYKEEIEKLIIISLKEAIITLKNRDKKAFIELFNKIEQITSNLETIKKIYYKEFNFVLNELAKKRFGATKVILSTSSSEVQNIFTDIKSRAQNTLFVFNEQSITFYSLIKALILITLGVLLGALYKRWIARLSKKWTNISDMSLKISANVGFYLIMFITLIIAMSSLGIDMSSISLIAGALSIGIGFGLQTVVSNFIAGIILMFERTIRIGDVIEINELLKGRVTDIRIRSTIIKTFDNIDIVVPNSSFIQNNVINWTLEDSLRRLHIPFSVAYGTKIEIVKELVLRELHESSLTFVRDVKDKIPDVRMELMNASSIDLELLVWVRTNDKIRPNSLKADFLLLIYNSLYKHDIEIPFPQLDIHMKEKKEEF